MTNTENVKAKPASALSPDKMAQVIRSGRVWVVTRYSATLAESDYEHVAREIADALNKRHAYPQLVAALCELVQACADQAGYKMPAERAAELLLISLGEIE